MSDSNRGERDKDLGQAFAILASIILCCLIVGVLTHSWTRNAADRDERAAYYQAEAERNQQAICVGRTGGLLAECLEEQRRASREAYTTEQDLNAQRDMAWWALWMFVVSAITALLTLWALWYVRGTLRATQDALDDTGNATKAMVRQNDLTEATQRAWIDIQLKVRRMEVWKGSLQLDYEVIFKNIGQTIARSVWTKVDVIIEGREYRKIAEARRERWLLPKGPSQLAMMPNESKSHLSVGSWLIKDMPWDKTEKPTLNLVVIAQAMYLPEGKRTSIERSESFRAFRIGVEGIDTISELFIEKSEMSYSGIKAPVVRNTAPNFTS